MKTISKNNDNRQILKQLSAPFSEMKKNGEIRTINEGLKNLYRAQGHEVLKTFEEWKKNGKHVKRGEKALLLWGFKTEKTIREKKKEITISFCPLLYVFSNLQVY